MDKLKNSSSKKVVVSIPTKDFYFAFISVPPTVDYLDFNLKIFPLEFRKN